MTISNILNISLSGVYYLNEIKQLIHEPEKYNFMYYHKLYFIMFPSYSNEKQQRFNLFISHSYLLTKAQNVAFILLGYRSKI